MHREALLRLMGQVLLRQCRAPECVCPQALLFMWRNAKTRRWRWDLRTSAGDHHQGEAENEDAARRFAAVTLHDHGLSRLRIVYSQPVEVPRA